MRFTTKPNPRAARAEVLHAHLERWETEWINNDAAAFSADAVGNTAKVAEHQMNKADIEQLQDAAIAELEELGIKVDIVAETPPTVIDDPA